MGTTEAELGLPLSQVHVGLAKLWEALGLQGPQTEDIFTLAVRRIQELEAERGDEDEGMPEVRGAIPAEAVEPDDLPRLPAL